MELPIRNAIFRGAVLAAALLAAGCEVHTVDRPPQSLDEYRRAAGGDDPYPVRTVLLHNLRRALDTELPEEQRAASLAVVAHLGGTDPDVRRQLAAALADEGSGPVFRETVLSVLLQEGEGEMGPYVVGLLPELEPDSELAREVLDWLARNPTPGVLADIVRMWAAESPTGPSEPRYRLIVERVTGKKWHGALLEAVNNPDFAARDEALGLLTARVTHESLAARVRALTPRTEQIGAMQAFLTRFDYLPATPKEVNTCAAILRRRGSLLDDAATLYASWKETSGYRFNIRDFHLLSRLALDPMRKNLRRTQLILELAQSFLRRKHVPRVVDRRSGLYDYTDRFSKHVESLSMADLWNLLLIDEMLRRPRVQQALRRMADSDRQDDRSAWGGLLFYENGQAEARLYPPSYQGSSDLQYRPGDRMKADAVDALGRFHGHFERVSNARRAGPTADEVLSASKGNYYGLVLTALDSARFCAHYYNPKGIVISVGVFRFR